MKLNKSEPFSSLINTSKQQQNSPSSSPSNSLHHFISHCIIFHDFSFLINNSKPAEKLKVIIQLSSTSFIMSRKKSILLSKNHLKDTRKTQDYNHRLSIFKINSFPYSHVLFRDFSLVPFPKKQ